MQFFTAATPLPPYIPFARFLLGMPINETAQLVYTLILSRIQLSQSNGWVDSAGRVYCRYTIQDLMADTGKSKSTIVTALNDLEKQDLLFRRRSGAGYANMLYLKVPVFNTSDVQKTAPQKSEKPNPNNKTNIKKNKKIKLNYDYEGDSL